MIRVIKLVIVCLTVIGIAGITFPVCAQEKAEQNVSSVSGEVVSVDLVKSEVVVKQLKDEVTGTYENTTFKVAPKTKITKGEAVLTLSDVKTADKVTVQYTTDALGAQAAETIAVEVIEAVPAK